MGVINARVRDVAGRTADGQSLDSGDRDGVATSDTRPLGSDRRKPQ
jgi:hypothetical protein